MCLVLRVWTLFASCSASFALRQDSDILSNNTYVQLRRRRRHRLSRSGTGRGSAPPEQLHLALADRRGNGAYAMSVCWYTPEDAKSNVFWRRNDGLLLGDVTEGNSTREFLCVSGGGLCVIEWREFHNSQRWYICNETVPFWAQRSKAAFWEAWCSGEEACFG